MNSTNYEEKERPTNVHLTYWVEKLRWGYRSSARSGGFGGRDALGGVGGDESSRKICLFCWCVAVWNLFLMEGDLLGGLRSFKIEPAVTGCAARALWLS